MCSIPASLHLCGCSSQHVKSSWIDLRIYFARQGARNRMLRHFCRRPQVRGGRRATQQPGEMSSSTTRKLHSRTTTSDTASCPRVLPVFLSHPPLPLHCDFDEGSYRGGLCAIVCVTQCTTVCWGLLCLHSGSITAGFHHPGDPRYRPGSGADTCDTYATFTTNPTLGSLACRQEPKFRS